MYESVLEAIKQGNWDYEPDSVPAQKYDSTAALPGTEEKLSILAERIENGLPLWHPNDRLTLEDESADD